MRRIGTIALTLTASLMGTATPGSASVQKAGDYSYVKENKTIPASSQASAKASCPGKTSVLGGGVFIAGSALEVEVAGRGPFDDDDEGSEPDDGWIGRGNAGPEDRLTTHAICTKTNKVEYRSKSVKFKAIQTDDAQVSCPEETVAVGGGVLLKDDATSNPMARTRSLGDAWQVSINNGTPGDPQKGRAHAVCIELGRGLAQAGIGDSQGAGQDNLDISCAGADGMRHVVSGGGYIEGDLTGELASTYPYDDSSDENSVPDDGWSNYFNNESGTSQSVVTTAQCRF